MNFGTPQYRRISPYEWLHLCAAERFAPFAIQFRLEAQTLPSPSALEDALFKASQANPGATIMPLRGWWWKTGRPPRVVQALPGETLTGQSALARKDIGDRDGPAIEVVHAPGAGLLFRCAHALMDANGLIHFARETFRALRGEPLEGTASPMSDRDYLALSRGPARRFLARPAASPLGPPNADTQGFTWACRSVPGEVGIVAARLAASLREIAPLAHRPERYRIMLPVDLRRSDRSLRSTQNFSNPLFLDMPVSADWPGCYRRILEALARREELARSAWDDVLPFFPKVLVAASLAVWHRRMVATGRYAVSATLSHVGRIQMGDFSAPGFTPTGAMLLPFDMPGAALTLVTLQHDRGLEIAASCPAATGDAGRLDRALDRICEGLVRGAPERRPTAIAPGVPSANERSAPGVYRLFELSAARHPRRVALSEGVQTLSYEDLERRAEACAGALVSRGSRPGDRIAILARPGLAAVVAILGILRLGASFVPLDPDWPVHRLRQVIDDCSPAGLLVDDGLDVGLPERGLPLSALVGEMSSAPLAADGAAPAYVMYTSGSTGRPKGVVVGNASLTNYLQWARSAYLEGLEAPVVFALFTSLAFDLTLTSLFLPLVSGGEVRAVDSRDPLSAARAILSDMRINAAKMTPSHLRLFTGLGIGESALRRIVVGGEAFACSLALDAWTQARGRVALFNEYGPTEATVGCVMHHYDPLRDREAFVPIGLPIAGTELALLGEGGLGVAEGAAGEIVLAGDCLALGYLGGEPPGSGFGAHAGLGEGRAYRTGDFARRREDGALEFLGRRDDQVKILGHRVELGEVEAAILDSGLCSDCAVVMEEVSGSRRLAAFVTWRDGGTERRLAEVLASRLPAPMRPARTIAMASLPLNANGKVDKALLARAATSPGTPSRRPPDPPLLEALRIALAEVTDNALVDVDPDRSLITEGLDSLQMMLLLTTCAQRFLPANARDSLFAGMEEVLRQPTLHRLARYLEALGARPGHG